jgi:hypothetical protein
MRVLRIAACLVVMSALSERANAEVVVAHAVAEEVVVSGEGADLGRINAFTRGRLDLIDMLGKAVREKHPLAEADDLASRIADHAVAWIEHEVQQVEGVDLHVVVELRGTVDTRTLNAPSPNHDAYRVAVEQFSHLREQAARLRATFNGESSDSRRADLLLTLEREDIEAIRLACFAPYALAGRGYCADYRRNTEQGFQLVSLMLRCGGEAGWRVFSPFHRIAVFLGEQVQALNERRIKPFEALARHVRHKELVMKMYPSLDAAKTAAVREPIQWRDPSGVVHETPSPEWPPEILLEYLSREVSVWQGMMMGWSVMQDALAGAPCAAPERQILGPEVVQESSAP